MDALEKRARERGLEPVTRFHLAKHFAWKANAADARALGAWLKDEKIEIVHCHRRQDHWVAGRAAARLGIPVVRTLHDGTPMGRGLRDRWLVARATDRLLYVSERARRHDVARWGWPEGFARFVPPAVDLDRYDPVRAGDLRRDLGLAPGTLVFGIAARVQAKRRFDLLLEAFRLASAELPDARLVIVGRGTRIEEVAVRPVRLLGLADRVVFAGYRREDYAAALNTFDVTLFLVPGSDGSCRALREAMALGKPALVTARGMLPEIVGDGEEGFVVAERAEVLAAAMVRMGREPGLRRKLGEAARLKAERDYALPLQAARVEAVYRDLLAAASVASRA